MPKTKRTKIYTTLKDKKRFFKECKRLGLIEIDNSEKALFSRMIKKIEQMEGD